MHINWLFFLFLCLCQFFWNYGSINAVESTVIRCIVMLATWIQYIHKYRYRLYYILLIEINQEQFSVRVANLSGMRWWLFARKLIYISTYNVCMREIRIDWQFFTLKVRDRPIFSLQWEHTRSLIDQCIKIDKTRGINTISQMRFDSSMLQSHICTRHAHIHGSRTHARMHVREPSRPNLI